MENSGTHHSDGHEVRGPASSSARLECTPFLDRIPLELLDNILRFISLLPNAPNWDKQMQLSSILGLYGVNGAVATFLKGRFRTLCISKTADCDYECHAYHWKVPYERVLWTESIDVAHYFVMRADGKSLHTIIIGDDMYDEARNVEDMIDDFHVTCRNVRSLVVVENSVAQTSAFRRQLEKLEDASNDPSVSIPKHCPYLLELIYRRKAYFILHCRDFNSPGHTIEDSICQSDMAEIVEELMKCPLLEDIHFEEVHAPAGNVLTALRQRGIHFRHENDSTIQDSI